WAAATWPLKSRLMVNTKSLILNNLKDKQITKGLKDHSKHLLTLFCYPLMGGFGTQESFSV
ncbi:MAG: hypothetical protein PVI90_08675, partial [Desulfobacteraceae bacterium]